jgi:hypothetical protein
MAQWANRDVLQVVLLGSFRNTDASDTIRATGEVDLILLCKAECAKCFVFGDRGFRGGRFGLIWKHMARDSFTRSPGC